MAWPIMGRPELLFAMLGVLKRSVNRSHVVQSICNGPHVRRYPSHCAGQRFRCGKLRPLTMSTWTYSRLIGDVESWSALLRFRRLPGVGVHYGGRVLREPFCDSRTSLTFRRRALMYQATAPIPNNISGTGPGLFMPKSPNSVRAFLLGLSGS